MKKKMNKLLNAVTTSLFVYLTWVFVVAPAYGFKMTWFQSIEVHLIMTLSAIVWQVIYGGIKRCYPK